MKAPELHRELGLVDAVAVGLGAIIGAGLFVVTGVAARMAGPAFLVGLGIAGIAATCNALSSAQLAARYPQSGGAYVYGYALLHPWAGITAGWLFLVSKLSAAGAVALGFAGHLTGLMPGLSPRVLAVSAVVALTGVNLLGIKKTGRLNTCIVVLTLGCLFAFVAAALPAFDAENLTPFAPHGVGGVLESAALLFFAYTGYARLATLGEEVRDPRRTIPRAILIAVGIATVLYAAVALAAVGVIGAEGMSATTDGTPAPLRRAASALPQRWVAPVVAVGATTAMFGVLLSQLLGISRMVFAMARNHDLPAGLAHLNATGVPDRGIVLAGLLAAALAALGTLTAVASSASFTVLVYYSIVNTAALRMARADRLFPRAVAWVGLLACVVLAGALVWKWMGYLLAG